MQQSLCIVVDLHTHRELLPKRWKTPCLLTVSLRTCQNCLTLLLIRTQHFPLLLLHNKYVQLAQHREAFIVEQPQEMECTWHQGSC